MRVAIIGYGFVGKALEFGLKDNVETFKVDPKLGTEIYDLVDFKPDVCFVCVPTPMNDDGTQNISILQDVTKEITKLSISSLIVLKSTVLPKYFTELKKLIPNIIYNPEFLRERSANEDFINSELIIFGGQKEYTEDLAKFYKNHTNCVNQTYQHTDLISASLIKYSINTFLATKVTFFNELYKLFKKSGSSDSWDDIVEIISIDKRIGPSHMQVPGHDGKFGFGGACFPKDAQALFLYSDEVNAPMTLLKKAIENNNAIRNNYDSISKRELEQNINYSDD